MAYWKEVHRDYFGCVCGQLGLERSPDMRVGCERLKVDRLVKSPKIGKIQISILTNSTG